MIIITINMFDVELKMTIITNCICFTFWYVFLSYTIPIKGEDQSEKAIRPIPALVRTYS